MSARFTFRLWPSVFTAIGVALLIGLGTWQGGRFLEKRDIEDVLAARVDLPILDIDTLTALENSALSYRRVRLTAGAVDPTQKQIIKYRHRNSKPGSWLVVPFVQDGHALLVNLGFIPIEGSDDAIAAIDLTTFKAPIEGILVKVENPVPDLRTRKSLKGAKKRPGWRSLDLDGIYASMPYEPTHRTILIRGETPEGELPIGGYEQVTQPYMTSDRHLGYSVTWYALAISLLALYLAASAGLMRRR